MGSYTQVSGAQRLCGGVLSTLSIAEYESTSAKLDCRTKALSVFESHSPSWIWAEGKGKAEVLKRGSLPTSVQTPGEIGFMLYFNCFLDDNDLGNVS